MSAVPARSSLPARLAAWARESLIARALGILLGLGVLAMIGGSALAGNGGVKPGPAASPPVPSSAPAAAPPASIDAGTIPLTRPELLPVATPEPVNATASAPSVPNVARATPDDPVDLNTARIDDLRRLPGVGAKRAEAILALRARLPGGHFKQIEDLLKVKGIGRAMLRRLHPLVRIS